MSFYTSLSGLQASQTDMSVISHNLANVNTNGFKKSRSEFADVIASSLASDPTKQVGSGVVVKANRQQFSEGNLRSTASALDLAIAGDGFFAMQTSGLNKQTNYTRNGTFLIDSDHFVVDSQGSNLLTYPVDSDGNIISAGSNSLVPLKLPETSGQSIATTKIALAANLSAKQAEPVGTFDRNDPTTFNYSTATTVYDADGTARTLANYYVRTQTPAVPTPTESKWEVHSYLGEEPLTLKGGTDDKFEMSFDSNGIMTAPTGAGTAVEFNTIIPKGTSTPIDLTQDFNNFTQYTSSFQVTNRSQDGRAAGQLSGVTVDSSGLITASFSNGDVNPVGRVAMANFTNPTGLRQLGNSYWSSTGLSGEPSLGSAGESGFGTLMAGTLESSNVDITEELVSLIAAQRNFQSNAKALETANSISQTIFNIRS
ncbi:MAG: flagellar hook protein FlgE [Sphingomonas bacterium]|nr:flagellar hook protein FlgE [Sphingomonas bacterium]